MTIPQIADTIKSKLSPGDTINVEQRSTDDFKFMGWRPVKVVAIYDRFTLTERNGCRECYPNSLMCKWIRRNELQCAKE